MTETNKAPEPTPAETPTAPMPPMPEAAPAAYPVPPTYAAGQPATPVHHGVHVGHRVSEGAIAAMVIGAVIFAMLSFGLGWTSRGALSRFESQGGGVAGQGYDRGGFGGQDGFSGYGQGRRGMMRGYGQGQGGQGSGSCYGRGQGGGWQGAPNGAPGFSAPNGSVPTTPTN